VERFIETVNILTEGKCDKLPRVANINVIMEILIGEEVSKCGTYGMRGGMFT